MILIDANIPVIAIDKGNHSHGQVRRWFEETLNGTEAVRFTWVNLLAFIRITTSSRIMAEPLTMIAALSYVNQWLALPVAGVIEPPDGHLAGLSGVCEDAQVRGPLVMDAHLAALAMHHGAVVASTDRDFRRFPGLRLVNPLD
ncbi:MAG TPA: TA system VapC family ribonuclease toxin [Mycobacteriales bacterium]|nr:TA system VapC family ribonuclease toxin [Mycobacteriales bacterium]